MLATPALAQITPTRNASDITTAIATGSAGVTGSAFEAIPPEGPPEANAVSTTPLGGFPRQGTSYGILTTGDATLADREDVSASVSLGGPNVRGDTDFDVTVLRVNLNVPAQLNCLSFDFRFLSAEFPTFVGSSFNDAFIAELDTSDWTTAGSAISAPNNFAFDPEGNPITINAAGAASMSAEQAARTPYGGATPLLRASTPVTPGARRLYLSIFDQGDQSLDSAVFVDNLRLESRAPANCRAGVVPADFVPPPTGGETVNLALVRGRVGIKVPGSSEFVPLVGVAQVPVGSLINARAGEFRLFSAARGDAIRSANFWGGLTRVRQGKRPGAITELRLAGRLQCGRKSTGSAAGEAETLRTRRKRRRGRGRFTWGRGGRGHRTRGRHSSASVRGTRWLVQDRCDNKTLTRVRQGRVTVRDFKRKRTIVLKKGQTYLAPGPKRVARRR